MAGETSLAALLASMQPVLRDPVYVFVTTTERFDAAALAPRMIFQEDEGTTLIVTRDAPS